MSQPFPFFLSFQVQILQKKTVCFNGIRTWIGRKEGEYADPLATTTACYP